MTIDVTKKHSYELKTKNLTAVINSEGTVVFNVIDKEHDDVVSLNKKDIDRLPELIEVLQNIEQILANDGE